MRRSCRKRGLGERRRGDGKRNKQRGHCAEGAVNEEGEMGSRNVKMGSRNVKMRV